MQRSTYVQELEDQFLALWPHRFDYIYAPHPNPGEKPLWHTETRFPLSDRLINQGSYLFGVRFGHDTAYAMVDIDAGSPYHPRRDPQALNRIITALEPLGLVRSLLIQSSDSGGLHLYLPFSEALPSWQIGLAASSLLENKGFKLLPGWLEVFPNQRHYSPEEQMSLFNGHRLPLQQGSYLLDDGLDPCLSTPDIFVRYWAMAKDGNAIDRAILDQILKKALRRNYRVTARAAKFLNDLNTEIEAGWTGAGQTNKLLGRVCLRSYIFGHILYAPKPLTGDALAQDIVRVARDLPGFAEWCRHTHELEAKAKDWTRSIEGSHYFPYGRDKIPVTDEKTEPSWNERQRQKVRERITAAVRQFTNQGKWPAGITTRFDALVGQGIGGSSLYKHKDLWHPRHQNLATATAEPLDLEVQRHSAKLISENDSNSSDSKGLAGRTETTSPEEGCKNQTPQAGNPIQQLKLIIEQTIQTVQNARHARKTAHTAQHQEATQAAYIAELRSWIASNDPILVSEAQERLKGLGLSP